MPAQAITISKKAGRAIRATLPRVLRKHVSVHTKVWHAAVGCVQSYM